MLVVVAPGQGAQSPGFLTPWLDVPGVRERLEWLSVVSGIDLLEHGTTSDADTIKDTAVAQPLIVGAGLVSLLSLFPHPSTAYSAIGAGAGHSVGEITAAVGAGVLTAEQAMVFVRERGSAMADAAARTATGMSAVLGGDADAVVTACDAVGLTAENINGAGQIVVAGTQPSSPMITRPRIRVRPLEVAGAFHTEHMVPAVGHPTNFNAITTHDPRIRLLSNADGRVVHDGRDVLRRLVHQISNPVRWDLCMETMADLGVTAILEIPPAGTLTGLAKRALPGVETLAVKTPDDLDAAWAMIQSHGTASDLTPTPQRMLVVPAKARSNGPWTRSPETNSAVHDRRERRHLRGSTPVHALHGGVLVEWLVEDGDPVSPGQPLVRLHPISDHSEGVYA